MRKTPIIFFILLSFHAFSCGSNKAKVSGLAPDAEIPSGGPAMSFEDEYTFMQNAIGASLADLAFCGELQTRLQAVYWEMLSDSSGQFLPTDLDLNQKSSLIRESGVLEGQLIEHSEKCAAAYNSIVTEATASKKALIEVPAILKFLKGLVTFSSDSESKLKTMYGKLSDTEKEELFNAVKNGHARYSEKISIFGATSNEFGTNLMTGKLNSEALAILKIANTGDNSGGSGFSKTFWDEAQESKQLPIDLSLKVGTSLIRDGADVLIEVASGSATGEFGKGVAKAKDIIDKIDNKESWFSNTWKDVRNFYDMKVKAYFESGAKRGPKEKYVAQDYIDFHGNITMAENGAVQVKNYRELQISDLRAKMNFTNANEVDSIVLIHEFRDGRRSVQVITQAAGGTNAAERYIPSSEILTENATTIVAIKKDPVTGQFKYTSTSARISSGQTATITLDVPEVSAPTTGGTGGGSVACEIVMKNIPGKVCMDFSQGSAPDPADAAKQTCDGYAANPEFGSATVVSSCPSNPMKTCPSSLWTSKFYSTDSTQTKNIACGADGSWVWGAN